MIMYASNTLLIVLIRMPAILHPPLEEFELHSFRPRSLFRLDQDGSSWSHCSGLNFGGEIVHTLKVRKLTIKTVESPFKAISISSRPVEDMVC